MSRPSEPPRLARRLLERALPADVREEIGGDLVEVFRRRCVSDGVGRARLWYGRQALAFSGRFLWERLRERWAAGGERGGVASPGERAPRESARRGPGAVAPRRAWRHPRALAPSWLDFKLGVRMLARYPGLTVVGGLAMAFAIAAGAATSAVVTQIVRPTLPLPDGDRIVGFDLRDAAGNDVELRVLYDFALWRDALTSVEDLGVYNTIERNLITGGDYGEPIHVAEIGAAAFRVARARPLLGRTLVPADEAAGAPPVVVIGEGVWRARFGSDPDVVGRSVRLGGAVHTVVGVMPEAYAFPSIHDVWIPFRLNPLDYGPGEGPTVRVFGRLAPGATLAQAQAELTALGARIAADHPESHEHLRPRVMAYAHTFLDPANVEVRIAALSTHAFLVLFLILVCANVAALVYARTATRESEIVVRSALGASRGRIVTQLFAEALVLGAAAAALGLAAAELGLRWGLGVFETVEQARLPFWIEVGLGPESVLYAGLLTLLGAIVAGVAPALKATRGLQARLREAGVGGTSLRFGRLWTGVIVTQVAFTVAFLPLLINAGRDTAEIGAPDFGFPAEEFLSARLHLDREAPGASAEMSQAEFRARLQAMYDELERRLMADPAVVGVTFASQLPGGYHSRRLFEVEGVAARSGSILERQVQPASVAVDFFDVLGAPILAGRGFHFGDLESDARVVVVNPSFVEQVLDGRNAIGRRVRYLCAGENCRTPDPQPGPWHEIVGVVDELPLTIDPDLPHNAGLYHPVAPGDAYPVRMAVHVRGNPESFAPRLRTLTAAVDPGLRLYELRPLDQIRWDLLMTYLFWLRVALLGGCIVLLLSTVGIYAIMSFTVSRRTREIGIRIALGAGRRRIVAAVFSRACLQLGLGVVVGVVFLAALVGGIPSPRESGLIAAGVAIVVGAGMLACIVPARRALRIEPTEALRADA